MDKMEEQMDDGLFHHDYFEHTREEKLKDSFDSLVKRTEQQIREMKAQQKQKKKINVLGGVNAFGIWVEEKVFRMKKKAFTLIEVMIVVAIIGLLSAIAVPKLKSAMHQAELSRPKMIREGGGDLMFRFIELFLLLAIVYLIANLIHYTIMRVTGMREGNFLFGLSSGWLKAEDQQKANKQQEETQPRKGRK